jgi:hypothetical protein
MVELNETKRINESEGEITKERETYHTVLIKTDDKEYRPVSKKEFTESTEEIHSLLRLLAYKGNIQIEVPNSIPALLVPKSISEEKEKLVKVKGKFENLVKKWKEETIFASTVFEMATNIAYQQIIGMGTSVIPFILKKLSEESDHWFWALKAITGEDPVPDTSRGNIEEMTKAWLEWGREKGYEC